MKMKKLKYVVALLTAAVLNVAAFPITASADDGMKIVAIGDSITNGYSMDGSLIASYPQLVSSYYGAELVNLAEDGMTSEGLLAKLSDANVQSEIANADVVLVTIGGNDIMKPVLNNEYVDASKYSTISEFIAAMKEKDQITILLMQKYLNSVMPEAIKNCNANMQEISSKLSSMTSGKVVIQTVYNPMDLDGDNTPLAGSGSMITLSTNVHNYLEGRPDNTLYPEDSGVNDIIRNLTESSIVDTFNTFMDHSYFYTHINNVDVHPNSKGHLAIAETIIETLNFPETGNENGTLMRKAYTNSGAEETLAGISSPINDGILGRVLKNGYGDVDADGNVNISDAMSILGIYSYNAAELTPEVTGVNAVAADANKDSSVGIDDALLVLQYYSERAAGLFDGTFEQFLNK